MFGLRFVNIASFNPRNASTCVFDGLADSLTRFLGLSGKKVKRGRKERKEAKEKWKRRGGVWFPPMKMSAYVVAIQSLCSVVANVIASANFVISCLDLVFKLSAL